MWTLWWVMAPNSAHTLLTHSGVHVEYLPSYSPDFQPTKVFSKIKALFCWLHDYYNQTTGDGILFDMYKVTKIITPKNTMGYYTCRLLLKNHLCMYNICYKNDQGLIGRDHWVKASFTPIWKPASFSSCTITYWKFYGPSLLSSLSSISTTFSFPCFLEAVDIEPDWMYQMTTMVYARQ